MSAADPRDRTWLFAWRTLMRVSGARRLRIGCSFVPRTEPDNWFTIVEDPRRASITAFELARGFERARSDYNLECLETARTTQRTHLGQRAGFIDVFIPVVRRQRVQGVLVCGPVLAERPSAESLWETWSQISRTPTDRDDEAFLAFVRGTLDSHLFEGPAFDALVAYLERIAETMAGSARLGRRIQDDLGEWFALRRAVPEAGMWAVAAELVDRDANPHWTAHYRETDRALEGIARMPNFVVVVAPAWPTESLPDSAELLLRTHELQRHCAALALDLPNTIAGRVGAEAAFLLTHVAVPRTRKPSSRSRPELTALGDRVRRLVRKNLGLEVFCGFSERAMHGADLPVRYDEALWAALWGLHRKRALTFYADAGPQSPETTLGLYRSSRRLYESFSSGLRNEAMVASQQVVKDVLWISGSSLEVTRSHFLELMWELLALTERRDALDARTSSEMLASVTSRLRKARTTHDTTHAFTELVRELLVTLERPGKLGKRAKLERARRFVESAGQSSRLDIDSVAARVGMSRSSFTRAFRSTYGSSFAHFATSARVEKSKVLLRSTGLGSAEISREAGWGSPSYFHQAFKRLTGMTPGEYKRGARSG